MPNEMNADQEQARKSSETIDNESIKDSLDIRSEQFDPVVLLYTENLKVSDKTPKVQYQNLAALESALKNYGIWDFNKRKKDKVVQSGKSTSTSKNAADNPFRSSDVVQQRNFQPHQLAISTKTMDKNHKRNLRNLFSLMETNLGPLGVLKKCVLEECHCKVVLRNEHGVRGTVTGKLICFDKYMNLLLENVVEKFLKRKYKYGANKISNSGEVCSDRLRDLGIALPTQTVKSINRKNCEITRVLKNLLVRGEQVVLVSIIEKNKS